MAERAIDAAPLSVALVTAVSSDDPHVFDRLVLESAEGDAVGVIAMLSLQLNLAWKKLADTEGLSEAEYFDVMGKAMAATVLKQENDPIWRVIDGEDPSAEDPPDGH